MKVFINDQEISCSDTMPLSEILIANHIPLVNIAVAMDNSVVPKAAWATTIPQDGSRIIIIKAVQGG